MDKQFSERSRYTREFRQRNRDAGLCPCGQPRFRGRTRCRYCLKCEASYARKRRRKS